VKLWILSDLHLEFWPFDVPDPRPEHDVVIIAGDLSSGNKALPGMVRGVRWIARNGLNEKPVIYIGGNHEGYGSTRDRGLEKARDEAAKHSNIHILQDQQLEFGNVRILGATLWTDYALEGLPFQWGTMQHAGRMMNDHLRIRLASAGYRCWRPEDALAEHVATRQWLKACLVEPLPEVKVVVVTHHAPSPKSLMFSNGDPLNGAYASDLSEIVSWADLWVHGHIHKSQDYRIGDCRVIANPRGYPMGRDPENLDFNPTLVIDTDQLSGDILLAAQENISAPKDGASGDILPQRLDAPPNAPGEYLLADDALLRADQV
jgi:Icc-related predicted phosphoesterase